MDLDLFNKSGAYRFTGSKAFVAEANSLLQLLKPSRVDVTNGFLNKCLSRLAKNSSDVAFGDFALRGGSSYHVPDATNAWAPAIISGYEVGEYIKNQTSKPYSKYGLLENYRAFDGETYIAICSVILIILLTKFLFNFHFKKSVSHLPLGTLRRRPALRVINELNIKSIRVVVSVAFFLISTPFLLMYKTTQVVTEKPFVIADYETLMRFNISIYSQITVHKSEYFKPLTRNIQGNDLTFRFFNYYQRRKFERKEFESNDLRRDDFINFIFRNYRLTRYLVEKKFVVITHLDASHYLKRKFCTTSGENEYFKIFVSKDASQKEILVGNAFRNGFSSPQVRAKLRRFAELMPRKTQIHPTGLTVEWLERNFLMSKERKSQQLVYCLDEKVEAYQKESAFACDVRFFAAFWMSLVCLVVVAFNVLLIEKLQHHLPLEISCIFFPPTFGRLKKLKSELQEG